MQARPLSPSSTHRAQLLAQARDHYRRASVITEAEGDSAATRLSRASNSSLSSAFSPSLLQSPVLTEDNGGMSTRTTSPDPSVFSDRGEDAVRTSKLMKKHHRKQVSFGDINLATEPFVRPDSPTLGDDVLSPTSPILVSPTIVPLSRFNASPPGLRTIVLLGEDSEDEEEEQEEEVREEPSPRGSLKHALGNYSSTLSFLRQQISTHLAAVDNPPPPPLSSAENDEMRRLDLEARIARLRERGWARPRFDAGRYEALREAATAEMNG